MNVIPYRPHQLAVAGGTIPLIAAAARGLKRTWDSLGPDRQADIRDYFGKRAKQAVDSMARRPRKVSSASRSSGVPPSPYRPLSRSGGFVLRRRRRFRIFRKRRLYRRRYRRAPLKPSRSFRDKVSQVLQPFITESIIVDDYCTVPSSTTVTNSVSTSASSSGIKCAYFSWNGNEPFGQLHPSIVRTAANVYDSSNNPGDLTVVIGKFRAEHTLTNTTNFDVKVTGYKVRARRDLPNAGRYSNSILADIAYGFWANRIDVADGGITNDGMTRVDLSPYQSSTFCQDYQIVTKRVTILKPGATTKYTVVHNRPRSCQAMSCCSVAAGGNYSSGSNLFVDRRGDTYWLWRVETADLLIDSVSKGSVETGAQVACHTRVVLYHRVPDVVSPYNGLNNSILGISGNMSIGAPGATVQYMNVYTGGAQTVGRLIP